MRLTLQQLSAQDAQFLHADTDTGFANVSLILMYAPPARGRPRLDSEMLIEHVRSRLHTSPVFQRRLQRVPFDLDYPYWVDDEHFDVESHVVCASLPKPGDWHQFRVFASRYHNKPMDMNRPLWEVCLLDGLNDIVGMPKGSFALILKAHHTAIDGATGMQFFAGLSDIDATGTPAVGASSASEIAGSALSGGEMLTRAVLNSVRAPIRMLDVLRRAATGALPMVARNLGRDGSDDESVSAVPITRFNQAVTPHKHFDACFFALDDFRKIKASVAGATINDVVLAVVGGGLRRYLLQHRELPDESLVAWVPINARPKSGSGAAATGNQIAVMTAPLYTHLTNPAARLLAISKFTQRSKAARSGTPAQLLTEMSQHFPAYSLALTTRLIMKANLYRPMGNVMVTNVPGAQVPMYLRGARCLHQLGLTPLGDGLGLCIGAPSYDGEISFIVMSTQEMLPDVEFFVQCLKEALPELRKRT
jgi:WS/DGAT/MGAT family acyltransferase